MPGPRGLNVWKADDSANRPLVLPDKAFDPRSAGYYLPSVFLDYRESHRLVLFQSFRTFWMQDSLDHYEYTHKRNSIQRCRCIGSVMFSALLPFGPTMDSHSLRNGFFILSTRHHLFAKPRP